jgi:polygalacturonase
MKLQKRVLLVVLLTIVVFAGCQQVDVDNGKPITQGVFDVRDFGAVGNGVTLDTKTIQAAINACSQAGGGKVYLSNGKFLSGTLYLKDNVTIYLEAGAVLLGSTDVNDYPVTIPEFRSYTDKYTDKSLIYAEKVKNISIAGRGTIDGPGCVLQGRVEGSAICTAGN